MTACSSGPSSSNHSTTGKINGVVEGSPLAADCDSSSTSTSEDEDVPEGQTGPEDRDEEPDNRRTMDSLVALTENISHMSFEPCSLPVAVQQTRRPSSSSVGKFN